MAMTREEFLAKQEVMKVLAQNGYPTYAKLLSLFDLHLTNDPDVVGYMIPDKAVITLNRELDIAQVGVIVRHEILHEYLTHQLRMQRKLGAERYANRSSAQHKRINIAGDYEISNLGYTENDKNIVRGLILNGKVIRGLVTEDDHEDWIDKSFEEMYDLLEEPDININLSDDYIAGWNKAVADYKAGRLKL